jgi:hypothetical protein
MKPVANFITGLSIKHNNEVVQLNVQSLNDMFFGEKISQQLLKQHSSSVLPIFLTVPLPVIAPVNAEGIDEKGIEFS